MHFKLICLFITLASIFWEVTTANSTLPQTRIIGGDNTFHLEYPYIAAILDPTAGFCNGAILSPTKIATSANCCNLLGNSANWIVGTGVDYLWDIRNSPHQEFIQAQSVRRVVIHPNFNGNTQTGWKYDACKVYLSAPLRLDSHTRSVQLCRAEPPVGSRSTITGWGSTSEGTFRVPTVLQKLDLRTISRGSCSQSYPAGSIDSSNFCAISTTANTRCNLGEGDGGAPLFHRSSSASEPCLAGIISWLGLPCGNFPYVFSNAANLNIYNFYDSD